MADIETVATEDEEFEVDDLIDEEEEVQEAAEEKYAPEDEKKRREGKSVRSMLQDHIREERVEKKVDSFLDAASDTEKELFAIFRKGDEDEKQLDRLIELVKQKASTADGKFVSEEEVEELVATKAAEAVGPGPLRQGGRPSKPDPREELMERNRKGDTDALTQLIAGDLFEAAASLRKTQE
jgi:ParB-like chromosome segregation protein Spo0J